VDVVTWLLAAVVALAMCLVFKSLAMQHYDPTSRSQPIPFALGALGFGASGLALVASVLGMAWSAVS
jgi:hypothetical protein